VSGTSVFHCKTHHIRFYDMGPEAGKPDFRCIACEIERADKAEAAHRPEGNAKSEVEKTAAWCLLSLMTIKRYKDRYGKDAHYETHQPRAWDNAREFLQHAMPAEYAAIETELSTMNGMP